MTTRPPASQTIARERAEIERSASEAAHASGTDLRMYDLSRYLDPPPDTAYPLEYCFHLLGDVRGKVVLDYGCGDGLNTVALARRGARVIAVDVSAALIDVARQRLELNVTPAERDSVDFVVGSAHDLSLRDQSVDVLFGIAILHHLDLELAAREVRRVLKPGGHAIFQEPIRNSALIRTIRRLIPYQTPDVSPDERPLTTTELMRFAHGFRRVGAKVFLLPTTNLISVLPPLRRRYLHAAHRFDAKLLRRFSSLRYYGSVCVLDFWT